MSKTSYKEMIQAIGPGIIFAGAAIGGSHLIYATKAGAKFGYSLLWLIILVNVFKYPFYEFAHRYAGTMKESLLQGYQRVGSWALPTYLVVVCITVIPNQAAVTFISASLLTQLTQVLTPFQWSIVVNIMCLAIVLFGRYRTLNNLMKFIVFGLSICTIMALVWAQTKSFPKTAVASSANLLEMATLVFAIKLMGWMPAPMEVSVWTSLWYLEHDKDIQSNLKSSLFDFNLGYISSLVIALVFMALGASVMYQSGVAFSNSGVKFVMQLIGLYTETLGKWCWFLVSFAACLTLLSTTLASLDGYSRAISQSWWELRKTKKSLHHTKYIVLAIIALGVTVMTLQFKNMIVLAGIASTVSFLADPLIGYINMRAVQISEFPHYARPGNILLWVAYSGLIFLILFGLVYVAWKLKVIF